jgi:hypothetical protein
MCARAIDAVFYERKYPRREDCQPERRIEEPDR